MRSGTAVRVMLITLKPNTNIMSVVGLDGANMPALRHDAGLNMKEVDAVVADGGVGGK